jgi:hypothetical protein
MDLAANSFPADSTMAASFVDNGPMVRCRVPAGDDASASKTKQAGLRLFSRLVQLMASTGSSSTSDSAMGPSTLGGIASTLARSQTLGLFQEWSPPRGFNVRVLPLPTGTTAFATNNPAAAEHILSSDAEAHWSGMTAATMVGLKFKEPITIAGLRAQFHVPEAVGEDTEEHLSASLPARLQVQVRLAPERAGGKPSHWVTAWQGGAPGESDFAEDEEGGSDEDEDEGAAESTEDEAKATDSLEGIATAADVDTVVSGSVKTLLSLPKSREAPSDFVFSQSMRVVSVRLRLRGHYPRDGSSSSTVAQQHAITRLQALELPDERSAPSALASLAAVRRWIQLSAHGASAALAKGGSLSEVEAAPLQALIDLARGSGSLEDLLAVVSVLREVGDVELPKSLRTSVEALLSSISAATQAVAARNTAEELLGRSFGAGGGNAPSWGPLEAKFAKDKGSYTSYLDLRENDTVVYARSSDAIQFITAGPFSSGKFEVEYELVEDTNSQCTCFGFSITDKLSSASYSSNEVYMYRAFNGYRYGLGSNDSPPSSLGDAAKVNKGDKIRFVADFGKGSGEIKAFINGKDAGVAFKGIRGKKLYPAVQFYSSSRTVRILQVLGPFSCGRPLSGASGAVVDADSASAGPTSVVAAMADASKQGVLALSKAAGRRGTSLRTGDAPGLGATAGDVWTGEGFLCHQDMRPVLRAHSGRVAPGDDAIETNTEEESKDHAAVSRVGAASDEDDEERDGTDAAVSTAVKASPWADTSFPDSKLFLDGAPCSRAFAGGLAIATKVERSNGEWGVIGRGGKAPAKPDGATPAALAAAAVSGPSLVLRTEDGDSLEVTRSLALMCPSEGEVTEMHGGPLSGEVEEDSGAIPRGKLAWDSKANPFAYVEIPLHKQYQRLTANCAIDSNTTSRAGGSGSDTAGGAASGRRSRRSRHSEGSSSDGSDSESDSSSSSEDEAPSSSGAAPEASSLAAVRVVFEVLADGHSIQRIEVQQATPGRAYVGKIDVSVLGVENVVLRAWCGSSDLHNVTAVFADAEAQPCTDWVCAGWRNPRERLDCRVWGVKRGETPATTTETVALAVPAESAPLSASAAVSLLLDSAGSLSHEYLREMHFFGSARDSCKESPWALESPFAVEVTPASLKAMAAELSACAAEAGSSDELMGRLVRALGIVFASLRRLVVSRISVTEVDGVLSASGKAARSAGEANADEALVTLSTVLQSLSFPQTAGVVAQSLMLLSTIAKDPSTIPTVYDPLYAAMSSPSVVEVELLWPASFLGSVGRRTAAFGGKADGEVSLMSAAATCPDGAVVAEEDEEKEEEAVEDKDGSDSDSDDDKAEKDPVTQLGKKWRGLSKTFTSTSDSVALQLLAACSQAGIPCETIPVWPSRLFVLFQVTDATTAARVVGLDVSKPGMIGAALRTVGIYDWSGVRGSKALGTCVEAQPNPSWDRKAHLLVSGDMSVRVYPSSSGATIEGVKREILAQLE